MKLPWLVWFAANSSIKAWAVLVNRVMTWSGIGLFWKRTRGMKHFWLWALLINAVSWGVLGIVLWNWRHSP